MQQRTLWLVGGIALLAACSDPPTTPSANASLLTSTVNATIWADVDSGKIGPGSHYAMYKPVNWNGSAVYYGHGFNDVSAPILVPDAQDNAGVMRDALGAMGYAVAMTSYSSNGYDYDDGLRRMHQLKGLLTSKFGAPKRNYLAGHSLGAQIALGLSEKFARQYDGALLMCGVLGGSRRHFEWLGDVRVLFDFFYPGALPGDVTYMPPGVTPNDITAAAQAAIGANPMPAFYIGMIDQTPIATSKNPFVDPSEYLYSLIYALVWHSRGINDVTARAQGHLPYGNASRVYTSSTLPPTVMQGVNAGVGRFVSPPDAQNWIKRNYEPTGAVSYPILTLHTRFDQSVPFFHETAFGAIVANAGTSNWVVQRTINRYGHCAFSVAEMLTAFGDLVNWVENDVKPTP